MVSRALAELLILCVCDARNESQRSTIQPKSSSQSCCLMRTNCRCARRMRKIDPRTNTSKWKEVKESSQRQQIYFYCEFNFHLNSRRAAEKEESGTAAEDQEEDASKLKSQTVDNVLNQSVSQLFKDRDGEEEDEEGSRRVPTTITTHRCCWCCCRQETEWRHERIMPGKFNLSPPLQVARNTYLQHCGFYYFKQLPID